MRRSWLRGAALTALALGMSAIPATSQASSHHSYNATNAQATLKRVAAPAVYLVQGIPDAAVSVTIDGSMVDGHVAAKAIVGPLQLSQGQHTVIFKSSKFTITSMFTIKGRSNDVVLHWPADTTAKPVVTVYRNDLQPVAMGKARVTVAHTAVVPPADIRVNGRVLFANIANGEFATIVVPGGTYPVDVVPTGETSHPYLGPVKLLVKKNALTRVFAIGAPTHGTKMDAIVQVLPLATKGSQAPRSVDAGEAGLVAQQPSVSNAGNGTSPVVPAVVLGSVCLVGLGLALSRRRRGVV